MVCPACGLDPKGEVAHELRELEITVRQIEALVENKELEPSVGEQIYQKIEARQTLLLIKKPGVQNVGGIPSSVNVLGLPLWHRLDRFLDSCPDAGALSILQRGQALAWYKQIPESDLTKLSIGNFVPLAQILRMAGLETQALHVYDLLLRHHPQAEETAHAAVEAGRFAFNESHTELARSFLELALKQPLKQGDLISVRDMLASLPADTEKQGEVVAAILVEPLKIPQEVPQASPPLPSAAPEHSWGQMLAGFMEERNILWGELVGGLLIVGCSIALVISLWRTLEQIPYFPFLVFAAITAALFGAGFYTLSHWKLESTSRGLLVIATLLTPLDFLVLAGFTQGRVAGIFDVVTEILALIAFTALVLRSAHILVGLPSSPASEGRSAIWHGDWLLTLAVVGASATQLLVPSWLDMAQPVTGLFVVLSLAPVVFQALAVGLVLLSLARLGPLDRPRANKLFLFLGPAMFAVIVALGFIVYWSDDALWSLRHLAVPIAVAAWPLLVCGAFIHNGLAHIPLTVVPEVKEEPTAVHGLSPAIARLGGTVLALVGAGIMVASLVLAWPRPIPIILIGGLNAAVLAGVALCFRFPFAHGPALACLTIGFLTAFHGLRGELTGDEETLGPRMLALAASPESGTALAFLGVVLAFLSEILVKAKRRVDGLHYIVASGIAGLAALLLVGKVGLIEPERAALVFAVCGFCGILLNCRWQQPWLTTLASFVVLGSIAFTIHWWDPGFEIARLWLMALLSQATAVLLGSLLLERWARAHSQTAEQFKATDVFVIPFFQCGMTFSFLALWPLLGSLAWDWLFVTTLCSLWLASLWLAIAWHRLWPGLFGAVQAALTLAVLLGVSSWLHGQEWVGAKASLLLHSHSLQSYGLGLAGLSLVWALARLGLRKNPRAMALLEPGWRGVNWAVLAMVIVGNVALTGAALFPEILREVMPVQKHGQIVNLFDGWPKLDLTMAWSLLALLALVLLASLWGSRPKDAVLGWILWALTLAVVTAYPWSRELAAGSILRWDLSVVFLGCSGLLWARTIIRQRGEHLGIAWSEDWDVGRWGRVLLLSGTVAPVLLITGLVAMVGFNGDKPAGPGADTFFAWLGWTVNVVVPLLLLVIGLTGYGVRENQAGYIFVAGLVLLATVTGGYALGVVTGGGIVDAREGVFIGQLGFIVVSLWALAWLRSGRWRDGTLLGLQVSLALAANCVLLLAAIGEILVHARGPWSAHVLQTGTWLGWFGLFTTLAATVWVLRLWLPSLIVHLLGSGGLGLGILAACMAAPFDPTGWRAYHVLTLAWTVLALCMLTASWAGSTFAALGPVFWNPERRQRAATILGQFFPERATRHWVEAIGLGVVLLALGGAWGDPGRPYWSCLATLAVSLLIGAMAVWARRPWYVYASGLLLQVVAFLVWQAWLVDRWGLQVWFAMGPELFDPFLLLQILALTIGSLVWSLVENRFRSRAVPVDLRTGVVPYAHASVLLAVQLLAMFALAALASDLFLLGMHVRGSLVWWAVGTTTLALLPCFCDVESSVFGLPLAPLYVLGLAAACFALHQMALSPDDLGLYGCLELAGYVFIANVLVQLSPRLASLGRVGKITQRSPGWLTGWFYPAQALLILPVIGLSFWICLSFPTLAERLVGPLALALLVGASFQSSYDGHGKAFPSRWVTLGLIAIALLVGSWALLDPDVAAPWLHRNVLLLAVLVLAGVVYRLGLGRSANPNSWSSAGRRLGEGMLGLSAVVLGLVLVQEFFLYDSDLRTTPLAWSGVFLVVALLAGLVMGGICIAIAKSNPGGLSDSTRVRCVWGAEFVLVLLLVHLRLNIPDLFPSFLGKNWALVTMFLGFLGVGLAELFQRRGMPVLAGPLQQTGLFLPLLPLLAYMVRPLAELNALGQAIPGLQPLFRYLDRLPDHFALHALLWFLLGLLYALTALLRRASIFAILAALAANFGLWVIYAHHETLSFLLHPQIWLLPLGLILLAAEHLNRQRLTTNQAQAVRYIGLLLIYLSSTADMFITGLGNSFLMPVVLALLAVAGVLAGILLRVRAFLFMGVAFLFLVVFAQIWHAAVDRSQTWVWWACGIVLGVAILTLFALFEKRRNDVLGMLKEIGRWR